jgi:hypothetical protein
MKWNKAQCAEADKASGGAYTWWAENGYDIDTTINPTQASQGMTANALRKVTEGVKWNRKKKDHPEAYGFGPAAYDLHYKWNDTTNSCERGVAITPWFRDALNCKGNFGETCDLGYSVADDITNKYTAYEKTKAEGGPINQALEDFFGVANTVIADAKKKKEGCAYDGWWDRKMCSVDHFTDGVGSFFSSNGPILVIGGLAIAYVVLSK